MHHFGVCHSSTPCFLGTICKRNKHAPQGTAATFVGYRGNSSLTAQSGASAACVGSAEKLRLKDPRVRLGSGMHTCPRATLRQGRKNYF